MLELPENVLELINAAVSQAVTQAVQQTKEALQAAAPPPAEEAAQDEKKYFPIMERLLFAYPAMKRLIADKEAYVKVELRERSKSVVGFSYNPTPKSREDIVDELEREKESEYAKTVRQFRLLERVIQQFEGKKEFIIIRMYYFNEDLEGNQRPPDAPQYSWETISLDIRKDVKTVRRWRNKLVREMAICLFGIDAALEVKAK